MSYRRIMSHRFVKKNPQTVPTIIVVANVFFTNWPTSLLYNTRI